MNAVMVSAVIFAVLSALAGMHVLVMYHQARKEPIPFLWNRVDMTFSSFACIMLGALSQVIIYYVPMT